MFKYTKITQAGSGILKMWTVKHSGPISGRPCIQYTLYPQQSAETKISKVYQQVNNWPSPSTRKWNFKINTNSYFYINQCQANSATHMFKQLMRIFIFSARCNIYISRLCYDVRVCLSLTEVHWVAVHAGNTAAATASEVEAIIRSLTNMAAAHWGVISRYASHC